jgi:nicotinamidase-related amidase
LECAVPFDLASALAPEHTAVLLIDLQRGFVGDLSSNELLPGVMAERNVLAHAQAVAAAARAARARVIHCVVRLRADLAGSPRNAPVLMAPFKRGSTVLAGSPGAEVVPELGPAPEDLVSSRAGGVSAFVGTDLDSTLRNLGIRTVVVAGVSANLGVLGTCVEAVDFGYQIAVVADAIAGYPPDYVDLVLRHTLSLLGSIVTAEQLVRLWGGTAERSRPARP